MSVILVFLAVITILLVGTINVNAADFPPYIGGKYTRGISRISWWMSYNNNGGWYEFQINNAIYNWQSPGWSNPITFVEASSNAGTILDFYSRPSNFWSSSNIIASTTHYDSNSTPMHPNNGKISGNYLFVIINLNDGIMHNSEVEKMRGTITHEIGHALSMGENNGNVNSIMCQTGAGRAVQRVKKIDNDKVVSIYK